MLRPGSVTRKKVTRNLQTVAWAVLSERCFEPPPSPQLGLRQQVCHTDTIAPAPFHSCSRLLCTRETEVLGVLLSVCVPIALVLLLFLQFF